MSCLYPFADCSRLTADGLRHLGCPSRPKVLRLDGIPAGYLTDALLDRLLLDSVLIYILFYVSFRLFSLIPSKLIRFCAIGFTHSSMFPENARREMQQQRLELTRLRSGFTLMRFFLLTPSQEVLDFIVWATMSGIGAAIHVPCPHETVLCILDVICYVFRGSQIKYKVETLLISLWAERMIRNFSHRLCNAM